MLTLSWQLISKISREMSTVYPSCACASQCLYAIAARQCHYSLPYSCSPLSCQFISKILKDMSTVYPSCVCASQCLYAIAARQCHCSLSYSSSPLSWQLISKIPRGMSTVVRRVHVQVISVCYCCTEMLLLVLLLLSRSIAGSVPPTSIVLFFFYKRSDGQGEALGSILQRTFPLCWKKDRYWQRPPPGLCQCETIG